MNTRRLALWLILLGMLTIRSQRTAAAGPGLEQSSVPDVLVSVTGQGIVLRYQGVTGALLGTFAAGLSDPEDVKLGPDNKVYLAEYGNSRILRFLQDGTPDGVFATLPANPYSLTFDDRGNLFVATDGAVYRLNPDGTPWAGAPDGLVGQGSGQLQFGSDGYLYVADLRTDAVYRFATDGSNASTFLSIPGGPVGIAFGPDGSLYVATGGECCGSAANSGTIWKVTGSAMEVFAQFPPLWGALNGLEFDNNGDLLAATAWAGSVHRIRPDGSSSDMASGLSFPQWASPMVPPPHLDSTPPSLTLPADIVVEATSSVGAVVTFDVTATASGREAPVTCAPSSGSTFPLGASAVTCSATSPSGVRGSGMFHVTVRDTTPPLLTLPGPIQINATSPAGASAIFTATASDTVDPNPSVTCQPSSSAQFPIGTTLVTCSATDGSGNTATGTFTVTIVGAPGQLANVVTQIQTFNVQQGIVSSLDSKLNDALSALSAASTGDFATACGSVYAFVNEVNAQSGRKITTQQATQLRNAANQIIATIGCR
jgi:sugar lactone lactonase YvrE